MRYDLNLWEFQDMIVKGTLNGVYSDEALRIIFDDMEERGEEFDIQTISEYDEYDEDHAKDEGFETLEEFAENKGGEIIDYIFGGSVVVIRR